MKKDTAYCGETASDQALDVEALGDSGAGSGSVGGDSLAAWSSDDSRHGDRSCKDVTVTVQGLTLRAPRRAWWARSGKPAHLLSGVTGSFSPASLSLVTGPSGSGKRALLDLIAGRGAPGSVEGTVSFSGVPPTRAFLRHRTAYVEAEDTLIPGLTVREMISYTAELRRPLADGAAAKRAAVEDLTRRLGLSGCKDTVIGDQGISRGEARRTSIAVQLISRPSVLLLDEPIAGLDVANANKVVMALKDAAANGATVIAAVARPTELALQTADSLAVLLRGRAVYWGPGGDAALRYAASLDLPAASSLSRTGTGAEWLCELYAAAAEDAQQAAALANAHDASRTHMVATKPHQPGKHAGRAASRAAAVVGPSGAAAAPCWWALATLLRFRAARRFTSLRWLTARIPAYLLIALVLSALYFGMGADVTILTSLQMSCLLFMWSAIPFWLSVAFLPTSISERRLFLRECADGLYHAPTYLVAKLAEEIAVVTPVSIVAAAIVFSLCKVQGALGVFMLATWSAFCCGIALAYAVAAWSPTIDIACTVLPLIVGVQLLFAGCLVPLVDVPRWLIWVSWLNPLRYTWASVMVNQFAGSRTKFVNGQPVLVYFQLMTEDPMSNTGIVWAFFAGFAVVAAAGMSVRRRRCRC